MSEQTSQFSLLRERRFRPFFLTQFLGAFNDNLYKNALVVLIAFTVISSGGPSPATLVNVSAGLFILPFFLFSATAGQWADKLEKSRLIRGIKLMEIAIMVLAAMALLANSVGLLIMILFLMGTQSALFGPVKYGILPQHLTESELVGGNALVETGTFLAILLGTIAGGALISMGSAGPALVAATVVAMAVLGWWTSRGIPEAPAVAPDLQVNWNPFTETWRIIQFTRRNRTVFLSILGISWFWFYGAIFLAQIPNYAKDVLGGSPQVVTLLLATFSVGIGVGSLLCERLSGRMVEIGLVPLGAFGMTVFAVDLAFAHGAPTSAELVGLGGFLARGWAWRVLFDLGAIAVFGGFFIVPLYALVQLRSEPSHRSRVIAGNNILNALFMVVAAIMAVVMLSAGLSIPQLFLVVALMNVAVAVFIFTLVPEFLMRLIVWMLIHTIYRLESQGLENVPEDGPAVLVCNHVSFVDALIIAAACRRPVRFLMYHVIFKIPVLNFVFRTSRAIPIAPKKEDPQALEHAFDEVARGLDAGDVVCIFPEGQLTADGEMNPFRAGIERIVERTPAPVVPMALRGLWGSFFSRRGGKAMGRFPRRFWSRIALVAAPPVAPGEVSAEALQDTVLALRGDWK